MIRWRLFCQSNGFCFSAEVIRKLEDKIIFMEKTAKEMKEDQIFCSREMSDLRKAHEEKIMELKCRFVIE